MTKQVVSSAFLIGFLLISICRSQGRLDARAAVGAREFHPAPGSQLPPPIDPFFKILGADHPGLGAYITGLGDVNGDGYGDFAVSSTLDTTFIFFGGLNLDDQADFFVLGGGAGIVAGDIDGDGYTDLVTSQKDYPPKLDPDRLGLVRVYLHNHTAHPYNPEPTLQMRGKNKNSGFGAGGATHLLGGDVNGDGKMDLLIQGYNDKTPNGIGILYLYLGSSVPDTIPDFQFMDTHGGEMRRNFANKFAVVDLNKDGYDDVIIQGMGKQATNEEIHLGNPQAQFGLPYRDVNFQDPNRTISFPWQFVDIDGDNCAEIFPLFEQENPPFGWGRCGMNFQNQTFLTDTAFPNPDPGILGVGFEIRSIGRFNSTRYTNYTIQWSVPLINDGVSCWIYQSGPGWQSQAIGFYGLQVFTAGVYGTPFLLGDVTGDNVDDFGLIWGAEPVGIGYPVWIFKGDSKYKLTGIETQSNQSSPIFSLYPNPVTSFDARRVYLRGNFDHASNLDITVYDLLGRSVVRAERHFESTGPFQIPVELGAMKSGSYFVSIVTGERSFVIPLTVLSH